MYSTKYVFYFLRLNKKSAGIMRIIAHNVVYFAHNLSFIRTNCERFKTIRITGVRVIK